MDGCRTLGHTIHRELVPLPSSARSEQVSSQESTWRGASAEPVDTTLSFDEVYAEGFAFVFRVLRSLGVRPWRLEDAAQDVFTVVHRKLAQFEGRSSVKTWLFGIAQRVASDYRRTERRKLSRLEPLSADMRCENEAPDAKLEAAQAASFIDRFLDSLSPEKRALFALVFIEEIPVPEVAGMLQIPLNTAYSRIRTLRADLRKALERQNRR